jgi:hypothetical protein
MMERQARKRETDEMRSNGDFDVDLEWGVEFGLMIWKMFLRFEATISRVEKGFSQEMLLSPLSSTARLNINHSNSSTTLYLYSLPLRGGKPPCWDSLDSKTSQTRLFLGRCVVDITVPIFRLLLNGCIRKTPSFSRFRL